MSLRETIRARWSGLTTADRLSFAVILFAFIGVLVVGLSCREPMIGDEVTHYYLVKNQEKIFPTPTITVDIPTAGGHVDRRYYPHVFLWHYAGAALTRLSANPFQVLTLYHSVFWLQLLFVAWLFARRESGADGWAAFAATAVLASLPMCLLFSVAFYQDIPAIAQVLTAFFFLRARKLWHSLLFMCLAICIKETALLFLPVYALCALLFFRHGESPWITWSRVLFISMVMLSFMVATSALFTLQFRKTYYPKSVLEDLSRSAIGRRLLETIPWQRTSKQADMPPKEDGPTYSDKEPAPMAVNFPGDLRNPVNILVYGGGLFWMLAIVAAAMTFLRPQVRRQMGKDGWWWIAGLWYIACTAWLMRNEPDARFFLPGIIFLIPPLARTVEALPCRFALPVLLLVLVFGQGSAVLAKTWQLRHVPAGITEAVRYFEANRLYKKTTMLFMYPEGNYRLFPYRHNWYLNGQLKKFWTSDNDARILILRKQAIGAIVIKKHLVGTIDRNMNNLGIYPDFFVAQIDRDPRFRRVLDNRDVTIYLAPPAD